MWLDRNINPESVSGTSSLQQLQSGLLCMPAHACRACDAGAADEQYIFDLDVRLQYSDDSTVLLHALEVMLSP